MTTFHSILFAGELGGGDGRTDEPDFFADLRLDQVVAALTAGREEYDLAGLFYLPLHELEAVPYRHHVLADLEQEPVLSAVRDFAGGMQQMRKHLALMAKLHYVRQKEHWFLQAASLYRDAVCTLQDKLGLLELRSRGFLGLRDYLNVYARSDEFTTLTDDTRRVSDDLATVRYAVHLRGNS